MTPSHSVRARMAAATCAAALLATTAALPVAAEPAPREVEEETATEAQVRGRRFPGKPMEGRLRWGSSIQYNAEPEARHEQHTNRPMGVRRTFWAWSQIHTGLTRTAGEDVADRRVPWLSFKTPGWSSIANGTHDATLRRLLRSLDALDGPVWLTLHHEPEMEGDPATHLAMNRRVRRLMNELGTDNIALAPILMAWTFNPNSGRNPNAYWDDTVYDFVGVDYYRGVPGTMLLNRWYLVRRWAARHNTVIGVAEWGLRGSDSTAAHHMRAFHRDARRSHLDGRGARVIALSYFDSHKDNRRLTDNVLTAFRNLVDHVRSANPR